jgi:hypothetical protein
VSKLFLKLLDFLILAILQSLKLGVKVKAEPPRVCRRPFGLSYAAMVGCSSMA